MHFDHIIVFAISFVMIAFHLDFELHITHDAMLHAFAVARHTWAAVQAAAFVDGKAF